FWLHANNAIDLSAVFKRQQRGNAGNIKARCRQRILIHIEFRHSHTPRHLLRQLNHYWGHHPARPAPRRPQVKQYRQRRAFHLSRKGGISNRHRLGSGERCFALSTNWLERLFLFWSKSVGRAAVWATD